MTSTVTASRFQMVRRLGEGAGGVVYEAVDHDRGTRVAVKTLRNVTTESLAWFEREFHAVKGIRHANLVTLGEFIRQGDQWLLTMELVEGTDFLDYVRPPAQGKDATFDEPRLRDGFRQLAEALSALHEAGLVHRDVKPSNVRVTREGRVVLLDFGLVIDVSTDNPWTQHAAGSPMYMAPEQAVSASVGAEADWYATGVLLFEALTGRAPFEGAPLEIMTRKQTEEAPPPSAICAGVPSDLDVLCAGLLRFDPPARPKGRHVLRALGSREAGARQYPSQIQETPLIGRTEELEALATALRDSSRGDQPVTVVIEGASGVGKSVLAERFARRVAVSDGEAVILTNECHAGSLRPFHGVVEIVDSLARFLGGLEAGEARKLVPAKPLPLVKMFPSLRRVEAVVECSRGSSPPPLALLRTRAFEGFRELLKRLGECRTLVILIDDVDHIDIDSLALLAELVRPPRGPRLLLVLTATAPPPPFPGDVRRVKLAPLGREDAKDLATAIQERTGTADPRLAERCASRANGDPLAIDLAVLHTKLAQELSEDATVQRVVARVVPLLDETTRRVLETIAVANVPLPVEVLERAAGLANGRLRQEAATLQVLHFARGVDRRNADAIEPYHERVRTAVLALLSDAQRRDLHRLIAVELETYELNDPSALATHWGRAGDGKQMAHYAAIAADQAIGRFAFECAARLHELALSSEHLSEDDRRSLLVKLGEALASAGLGRRASEAFARAAQGASAAQGRELRRRAAEELLMVGDIDAGTQKLRDVTSRVGIWMPSSSIATALALFLFRVVLRVRGLRFEVREEESIPAKDVTRMWVCGGVARVLSLVKAPLAEYFNVRMLLFALRAGSAYAVSYALALEAGWVAARGIRSQVRTDELMTLAQKLAQESGVPRVVATAQAIRGYIAYMQGFGREAMAAQERSIELALDQTTSSISALRQMQLNFLVTRASLGDVQEVSAELRSLLREGRDRGDLAITTAVYVFPYLWRGWLRDGDSSDVRAEIEEVMSRWTHVGYLSHHHGACGALAELDLYEGRGREAFERVAADFPRARRAGRLVVERVHVTARERRARSALAAAAQETRPKERSRLLAAAARDGRWLRRAPPAYAKAWAHVVDAGIAAIAGNAALAIESLEKAIAGFDATQDRLAAACARIRLGAILGDTARGRETLEAGEAFMREQGVSAPHRLALALVPAELSRRA